MGDETTSGPSDPAMTEQQDWRLQVTFDADDVRGVLQRLLGRLRGPDVVKEIEATVPHDVVITHNGRLLFAYAASEAGLAAARSAIENVLRQDGIEASLRVGHWDGELDDWHQTDPPLTASEKQADEAAYRDADAIETRTVVATSGRGVRAEFERTMRGWADRLGLQCEIVEHPHLITTQVAFTVTGPKRKIDEFAQGLVAEGWAYVRTDNAVLLSPL
jgi:hypothetical protein